MTTITVLPNPPGTPGYTALAGGAEAAGETVGQAIDALVSRSGSSSGTTLIVVQPKGPDEFFTAEQQTRLAELMACWREARDSASPFPAEQRAELNELIA